MANVPNVADIVESWAVNMVGYIVEQKNIDFEVTETKKKVKFRGVPPQPLREELLQLKPEGMRNWRFYTIFCNKFFPVNSLLEIDGIKYRVDGVKNWRKVYGYYEIELHEDYE